MLKNLFTKRNKNKNNEVDYSCSMDEAGIADILFIKLKKDITNAVNNYGKNIEYVIMSTDITYSVLFSSGVSRIRIFNRINYLLEESIGFRMRYSPNKNSPLYGVGNRIIVSKYNKYSSNTN